MENERNVPPTSNTQQNSPMTMELDTVNTSGQLIKQTTQSTINDSVLSNCKSVDPHCGDKNNLNLENDYIAPCEDPYDKAWKYLSKHDILHLFQGLTANVFYNKPGDPLESMIQQIEKLQEEDRQRKGVITRTDVSIPNQAT